MVSEGADSNNVCGNIPGREKRLQNIKASPPTPRIYRRLSQGVKGPDDTADHSSPFSADVKNK